MFCILYCGEVSDISKVFSALWALVFCGILTLLPTTARRIGIILLITVFALTCILQAVMLNLFGTFFSFADLSYTGDGMAFFSFTYLKVRKLLWITVTVAIAMAIFLAWNLKKRKYSIIQVIVGLLLITFGIMGINSRHQGILNGVNTTIAWDTAAQHENDADIYQNMSNKDYVMSMTGIYQYLYRSFMVSSGWENQLNNGEMYQYLDEYYASVPEDVHTLNEMSGIYEGKNVLFVMLESIDTWMLTEEYMPNLYDVQQKSMDFVNHHSPLFISAGTFNTEFTANTSLIPPANGIDIKVYKENMFTQSLANCFKNIGYSVNSFHSSNPHIYNRGQIHQNWGYVKYHNWEDMNMENYMLDSQMINDYSKMTADAPFFSFAITYSGHGPYSEEMEVISNGHIELAKQLIANKSIDASEDDLEEYTYAIAHAMETDAFVGGLIKKLEADNLLDDTVLVFFTDHYGKYMTNHELVMELKGVEEKDFLCKTPFFIYHSGTTAQKVETVSSTVDIAPTLANMFGLDVDYKYYTGVDIFSDEEHYVIFPGNSWYDGETYYTVEYEGKKTQKILERNEEISEKLKRSEYILKSDYFSYLLEKE